MTLTIEIKNRGTLNLLRELEALGLIRVQAPSTRNAAQKESPPNRWLRGSCKNLPEGSVAEFLTRCRADKERELATEKYQDGEHTGRA